MIKFERGSVNFTSLVYNGSGCLVTASTIRIGEEAWTAGLGSPLGRRVA